MGCAVFSSISCVFERDVTQYADILRLEEWLSSCLQWWSVTTLARQSLRVYLVQYVSAAVSDRRHRLQNGGDGYNCAGTRSPCFKVCCFVSCDLTLALEPLFCSALSLAILHNNSLVFFPATAAPVATVRACCTSTPSFLSPIVFSQHSEHVVAPLPHCLFVTF